MADYVFQRRQAVTDLVQIAFHITLENEAAAARFLDAADETFQQLLRSPELGATGEFRARHLKGIRRWRVNGFESFLVFYRPVDDGIEIVRVLHGARDIESLFNKTP
jgi:toxin ParE1/3/4